MASATEISRLDYIEKEKLEKLLSLVDLDSDVLSILINEPEDGQTLVYEATSGKWKNKAVSGGGDLVVAVLTWEGNDASLSMTYEEVAEAISQNKVVTIYSDGDMYYYQHFMPSLYEGESGTFYFANILSQSVLIGEQEGEQIELARITVNADGVQFADYIPIYPTEGTAL